MTKENLVIIWLSIQIAVMSWLWMQAEKKVSYYEGQHDLQTWASEAQDGACGPYDQPTTAEKRAKKRV